MRLDPAELRFGVAPKILIDCAQQLHERARPFSFCDFCKALGAPEREARPVLDAMVIEGFVEPAEGVYQGTQKLGQLALASISVGIGRAEAIELFAEVLRMAEKINDDRINFPSPVTCIVVFGSFLTDAAVLSDLDLGISIGRAVRTREDIAQIMKDFKRGRPGSEARTYTALRLKKPKKISVHTLEEVVRLGTPYRVVWGELPTYCLQHP